jgi:hypothetical protein
MSSDSENFDSLRKLMAFKRHEQPPPGYFDGFSGEVIGRLRADRPGARELGEMLEPAPWLMRIFRLFETKPFFAGAFGVGVCALLISGIVYSEQMKPTPVAEITAPVIGGASLASITPSNPDNQATGRMQELTTTNASALEAQRLFQQLQVKPTPVSFSKPGGF